MPSLKHLSNFWITLEMALINCQINFDLNCFKKCIIVAADVANQGATFSVTDTKLYIPVVILSTQDKTKLMKQLKSSFKRTINRNKYQLKISTERIVKPSIQKSIFRLLHWSKFSRSKQTFCFIIWRQSTK